MTHPRPAPGRPHAPGRMPTHKQQHGMMLIESLVAIVIVMLGILGIAGLTTKSVASAGHAQYRTEAGMYAAQIVQLISLKVDRSSPAALTTSLNQFAHQASGSQCNFNGAQEINDAELTKVLKAARGEAAVNDYVHGLPGATATGQQVTVDTTNNLNQVTVTLCWKGPGDTGKRNYQLQAYVH